MSNMYPDELTIVQRESIINRILNDISRLIPLIPIDQQHYAYCIASQYLPLEDMKMAADLFAESLITERNLIKQEDTNAQHQV